MDDLTIWELLAYWGTITLIPVVSLLVHFWKEGRDDDKSEKVVNAVEVVHAHWEDGYAIHNGKEAYQSIDCSHCNDIFKIESHDR